MWGSTPGAEGAELMATGWKKYLRTLLAGTLLFGGAVTASLAVGVLPASASTLTVTDCSGSTSDAGSLPTAVASAASGDTITFKPGLSCPAKSPITLTSTISINQNLTITGPGASTMVVSGDNAVEVFAVNSGTVTISGLTIENGDSPAGGGGILNEGTLTINSSTVSGNTDNGESGGGGGILNEGTLTINSSTVSGNTANDYPGGGIFNFTGTLTINSSTVSGNTVNGFPGGGIGNFSGFLTINSSTVSGNTSVEGAGIIIDGGSTTLGATIVAANTGGNCSSFAGSFASDGYNLTDDPSTNNTCDFTASTDVVNGSPDLGPLAYNGGPTMTMLPGTGSSAIGVIPSSPAGSFCPRTDQRGLESTGNCTIGAVEPVHCATGLHPHVLTATYATGTFTGLFCLNGKGYGTYTQGGVSGPGHVYALKGYTIITASGTQVRMLGITKGTYSKFTEVAPVPIKTGTFKLT